MFFFIVSVSALTVMVAALVVTSETVNDMPGMVLAKVLVLDSSSTPLSSTLALAAACVWLCPSLVKAGSISTEKALSVPVSLERSIRRSLPSTSVTTEA